MRLLIPRRIAIWLIAANPPPTTGHDLHANSLRVNLVWTPAVAVRAKHPADGRSAATRHPNYLRQLLSRGDYGPSLTVPRMIGTENLFLACPARQSCAAL